MKILIINPYTPENLTTIDITDDFAYAIDEHTYYRLRQAFGKVLGADNPHDLIIDTFTDEQWEDIAPFNPLDYPCDACGGTGEFDRPPVRGADTTVKRTCRACQGSGYGGPPKD